MLGEADVLLVRRGDPTRDTPSPVSIHGLPVWEMLARELASDGMTLAVCSDRDVLDASVGAILLWDFGSIVRIPRELRGRELVSWCLESPLVAHRAFHHLEEIVEASRATLTFSGAKALVANSDDVTSINYPITPREPVVDDWENRDFLVMIASNKRLRPSFANVDLRRPYRSARVIASNVLAQTYRLRGSWSLPDLYETRLEAVRFFAGESGFRLFGKGWDGEGALAGRASSVYGGHAAVKDETLRRFRFCLCFENTRFPGYITEKIFDCLFAGTIPVYLGAPDVARFLPAETFIDAAGFPTVAALRDYLRDVGPTQAAVYLEAARFFLSSADFHRFHESAFVAALIRQVKRVQRG